MLQIKIFAFLILFLTFPVIAHSFEMGSRMVRVAFFPMPGFHQYDDEGQPTGYDVDYLKKIATLARWDVHYIPMPSWGAALKAVEAGEVDLMGAVLLDAKRVDRFEYSAQSAGQTKEVLFAPMGSPLLFEDFSNFKGLRVGCVRDSLRRATFDRYASQHGFTPVMVYFNTVQAMRKAMAAGTINAMVAAVLELLPQDRILGEISPAPFYYVGTKGTNILMTELDLAMSQLHLSEPDFEDKLMAKWYPQTHVFPFNRAEIDYIAANPGLTISILPNRAPLSSFNKESGVFEGVVPDILKLLSKECGFEFSLIPMPEDMVAATVLTKGLGMAVAGVSRHEEQLKDRRIVLTQSMGDSSVVMLGRSGHPFNDDLPLRIAVPPSLRVAKDFLATEYPHFQQVAIESTQEAFDALVDGRIDGLVQSRHVLKPFLQGPRYADLWVVPTINIEEHLAIALPATADPLLLSILDKGIKKLNKQDVQQIFINHTLAKSYVLTLDDILLHYRQPLLLITGLTILCISLLSYGLYARHKNIQLIRMNEETLKNITNNINGGVITIRPSDGFLVTYANQGFLKLLGYDSQEYQENGAIDCMAYIHPDDVADFQNILYRRKESGGIVVADVRVCNKNGEYVPVLIRGTVGRDSHKREVLYCVIVDITEQKALIAEREMEKEKYRILLEQSTDMIFEYDAAAHLVSSSPTFRDAFSISAQSGDQFNLPLHPDDQALVGSMLNEIRQGNRHSARKVRLRHSAGVYFWFRLVLSGITNAGTLQRVVGRIENIHAEVMEHQTLETLAMHDPLCGLLNRKAFQEHVEKNLCSGGSEKHGAIFFMDLDNFKLLNDTLGHQAGDKALKDVGSILRKLFRESDPVGRFGGDEFCAYTSDITTERIIEKAKSINMALCLQYYGDNGEAVSISASVGVACCPQDGISSDVLLERADKALYQAKSLGKNQTAFYSPLVSNN